MTKSSVTQSELGLNPEAQFKQLDQRRSQDLRAGKISHNERSPGVTMRSPRTGKVIPCNRCGRVQVLGGRCVGCATQRIGSTGLERINSILSRLSFVEESPEQEQLNLFTSEPKPKPQEIQLKGLCCCGSRFAKTGAGRRPHESSLHCDQCRRFIAWIPSSELNRLVKRG